MVGAYHARYSLLTDYPAGLRPWLSMRQHLWLDAIAGAALCGAGLALRRQPAEQRAMLIAAGLAELAVVSCSSGWEAEGLPVRGLHRRFQPAFHVEQDPWLLTVLAKSQHHAA